MKILESAGVSSAIFTAKFGKGALTLGSAGVFFNAIFGVGNLVWIGILAIVTVLDWISGIRAAKKDGTYTSEYGKNGIYRTLVMFILPVLGNFVDKALVTTVSINGYTLGVFFFLLTGGLIYHTLMSTAANFERAGWGRWVPIKVLESVASEIQAKTQRSEARKSDINSK
ncbi:phage holin family protein [Niallia sp. 03190]|uniref:phage holin family protein n=1 Tax=Niallia sp. 03190 TaxID=3458061 RepID=UPI0040442365